VNSAGSPVRYEQLPKKLIQAFLATEDDRFFRHHGVDWQGILRAAVANLKAGGIRQGRARSPCRSPAICF